MGVLTPVCVSTKATGFSLTAGELLFHSAWDTMGGGDRLTWEQPLSSHRTQLCVWSYYERPSGKDDPTDNNYAHYSF